MSKKIETEYQFEPFQIFPQARVYKTKLTKKFKEREVWKRPDRGELKATIPGTVTSIEVKVGDRVEEGSILLSFEAMKMQNRVLAPFEGSVKAIELIVGQSCKKGELLIYLEPLIKEDSVEDDPIIASDLGLIV